MERKIILAVQLDPLDSSFTSGDVLGMLGRLGAVATVFESDTQYVHSEGLERLIWLCAPLDDDQSYAHVSGPGCIGGRHLSADAIAKMRDVGACVGFFAEYPRAYKYGAPPYAVAGAGDTFAEGVAGKHLFKVDPRRFCAQSHDRDDDAPEQIWLQIALPN